jgi:hypothetical protein
MLKTTTLLKKLPFLPIYQYHFIHHVFLRRKTTLIEDNLKTRAIVKAKRIQEIFFILKRILWLNPKINLNLATLETCIK